jgi:TPR repeat protein
MRSCTTATQYFKTVAERAFFATETNKLFGEAYATFRSAPLTLTLERYLRLAEMGYEAGESNAARVMDEIASKTYTEEQRNSFLGTLHYVLDLFSMSHPPLEGTADAMKLYERAAEQGNSRARVRVGDYFFYGYGDVGEPDLVEAAAHYRLASEGRDAQANFNLGYQHHYGLGLAKDTHLAKRYYDLAKETSTDARFAVSLVLALLWFETAQRAFFSGDKFFTEDPAVATWVDWWKSPSRLVPGVPGILDMGTDTLLIISLLAAFVGIGMFRENRNQRRRREILAGNAGNIAT